MEIKQVVGIVQDNAPVDSGALKFRGHNTQDVGTFLLTRYKTQLLPYIVFQEEGFTHYKSGEFITKNQYFIRNDTVGAINRAESLNTHGMSGGATRHYSKRAKQRYNTAIVGGGTVSKLKR